VSLGHDEGGCWSLSARLPADEAALVERALVAARDELFRAGEHDPGHRPAPCDVSWADALLSMADRSLGSASGARPHHDRHVVLLHVEAEVDAVSGHLHLGPGLSDGLRRFVGCDSRVRPVIEGGGRAVSVGRAFAPSPTAPGW